MSDSTGSGSGGGRGGGGHAASSSVASSHDSRGSVDEDVRTTISKNSKPIVFKPRHHLPPFSSLRVWEHTAFGLMPRSLSICAVVLPLLFGYIDGLPLHHRSLFSCSLFLLLLD